MRRPLVEWATDVRVGTGSSTEPEQLAAVSPSYEVWVQRTKPAVLNVGAAVFVPERIAVTHGIGERQFPSVPLVFAG